MGRLALQHIECFHLILLSLLARRIDRAGWVVKGGVNLRAWFGSRRYSEDLDIDAVRGQPHVLEEKVDKLLESRPFVDLLATQALSLARSSKPKQTETTQRWKFEIHAHKFPVPLHTRVEFSRRGSREEEYVLEPVRPEIVRPYGLLAPTVYHYTARSAVRQKIQALVSRAETQARDVWDLDHLLRTIGADARPLPAVLRRTLDEAIARVTALSFDVFKAQIVPYLTAADQELYGTPDAWARMCELVAGRLAELKDV